MAKTIESILRDFVRHVGDLKAEDDPAGTGFHREFRVLRELQIQDKNEGRFCVDDGKKDENIKKNRYKDILPRDDKRVKLTANPGEAGTDYINATFIEDVHNDNGYIAAQGPMPSTVVDFWRMLWEYNTEIVFMVCKLKEDGKAKCERYWPEGDKGMTFGDITVYKDSEEEVQDHFVRRQLRAVRQGETHRMTQFHYTGWPDHNIPSSPDALRCMIEEVRDYRKQPTIPMVVHCSAGCGRTGTICAIDLAWTLLDKGMIEEGFSMFEIIKCLREQRMSMVQTPDQYEYSHMVIKSLCKEWLVSFAKHDYENVVLGGGGGQVLEPPEEEYSNIAVRPADSKRKELSGDNKGVMVTQITRDNETAQRASSPQKPQIKTQKPLITAQKPQLQLAGATAMTTTTSPTPTPTTPSPTARTSPTAKSPRPKTMSVENYSNVDFIGGEYVEVSRKASLSPTTFLPPTLPSKKNPPLDTGRLDPSPPSTPTPTHASKPNSLSQPSKAALIMLAGTGTDPRIVQTAGPSSKRHQAPKPPAAEVLRLQSTPTPVSAQAEKKAVSRQASAPNYENYQLPPKRKTEEEPSTIYSNDASDEVTEGAPVLPQRNYKPEEITTRPAAAAVEKDTRRGSKPNYDNVIVTKPPATNNTTATNNTAIRQHANKPSPTTTPTTTTPFSYQRAPQPLPPKVQEGHAPPPMVHTAAPRPLVVVGANGGGGGGVGGRHLPGTAVAMGGGPTVVSMSRPGSIKNRKSPASSVSSSGSMPPSGSVASSSGHVQVARAPNSGVKLRNHAPLTQPIAAAPVPGQIDVGKSGLTKKKVIYLTEVPKKVRGPRGMPADWTNRDKNHRGTYL